MITIQYAYSGKKIQHLILQLCTTHLVSNVRAFNFSAHFTRGDSGSAVIFQSPYGYPLKTILNVLDQLKKLKVIGTDRRTVGQSGRAAQFEI